MDKKTLLPLAKSSPVCLLTIVFLLFFLLVGRGYAHTQIDPPQPPEQNPKPPSCPTGDGGSSCSCEKGGTEDKVVFLSGEETFHRVDMRINDVYPIVIARTYSSNTEYDSPLGYGWSFNFDKRLFEYPDNSVVIRHGCGNLNRYIYTGGSYQPDSSIGSQNFSLVKNPDDSFTVTYPNGERDVYDTEGRLQATFDVAGNSLEFNYDPVGKQPLWGSSPYTTNPGQSILAAYVHQLTKIQVRHANGLAGHFVNFNYDANTGRLTTIVASDGRQLTYHHDVTTDNLTLGNLIRVDGLENKVSIYAYEDKVGEVYQDYHNITHIQEGLNATPVNLTYNADDQAYIEQKGNKTTTFDFSLSPFQVTVTETIRDDQGGSPQPAISVYQFDELGFTEFMRDPLGNETRYVLDSFGNKLQELIYQGSETTGTLLKTIDRTFDANNNTRTEAVTLQSGEVITTTWTYDGRQKASEILVSSLDPAKQFKTEWTYHHDAQGRATRVQEVREYKDDGSSYLSTQYTYNANGDVLTQTLPDGHIIVNEYSATYAGRYVTRRYHQVNGSPVPDLEQTYTYDAYGNRTTVTDARGHLTTTYYDNLNRRREVVNHLGHITRYTYDDRGNLTHIIRDRSAINDQLDISRMTYDGENRLTQLERTDDSGNYITLVQNTYDSGGQLYTRTNSLGQTTQLGYDLAHRLISLTNHRNESIHFTLDALGNRTHTEIRNSSGVVVKHNDATYDALNRQLSEIGATSNQTTQYDYDAMGNRVSMTDALNRPATQYTYDTLSRLTAVQDANSETTQYGYHDRGWLETVTDPRSLVTTYNYNELGQLDNQVSPDTGTTLYTYDLAGNKHTQTDARNITATYTYDALNRLATIVYPDASQNVTFTYDQGTNGLGRLTGITDASGSTDYTYNPWGDLIQETRVVNGQTFNTHYGYDTEHRLVGIIYPSGRIVTLNPAANNDIHQITSTYQSVTQTLLDSITYQPYGGIDTWQFGNGLSFNQDLDQDYRLTDQQVGSVYDRSLTYNDVNNITAITNNLDATRTQTFDYDNLDRLTDASGIYGSLHYDYDEDGNRTQETRDTTQITTYSYPVSSNRLDATNGTVNQLLGYDDNGNTSSKGAISYQYDNTNRMSQATQGSIIAHYTYNGLGQRVKKDVNGTVTLFIYNQSGQLIAEANGSGVIQREYAYYQNRPIAMLAYGTTADVYYYHTDHLNTPQVMTDQAQGIVWEGDYEPFGEVDITTNAVENNLRFPGQYYDQETNQHYNYYRDYDPSIGRYVESDPVGQAAGYNTYVYVLGNPISNLDPLGLKCCTMQTEVDMDCVIDQNNQFSDCVDIADFLFAGTKALCQFFRVPYGSDVCEKVAELAHHDAVNDCREGLQKGLSGCTKEVCK